MYVLCTQSQFTSLTSTKDFSLSSCCSFSPIFLLSSSSYSSFGSLYVCVPYFGRVTRSWPPKKFRKHRSLWPSLAHSFTRTAFSRYALDVATLVCYKVRFIGCNTNFPSIFLFLQYVSIRIFRSSKSKNETRRSYTFDGEYDCRDHATRSG